MSQQKNLTSENLNFKDVSLMLFQNRGELTKSRTSNTISFYDIMPKYSRNGSEPYVIDDAKATTRVYDFVFDGNSYVIEVEAAKLRSENDGWEYHFPSTKEEIIEDVLRHLLSVHKQLSFFDDNVGCQFTLYLIKQELKKYGKTRSSSDIRNSLTVLRKSQLAVYRAETYKKGMGDPVFSGPFFADATVIDLNDWFNRASLDQDKDCKGRVKFHNMVTEGIKECDFRLLRYDICMQYKSDIARWLHKRISHRHTGADANTPYSIKLSTIFNDGNWLWSHRMDRNKAKFSAAIKEMVKLGQLDDTNPIKFNKIKGQTSAAADYLCQIYLSKDFINHIIMSNIVYGQNNTKYKSYQEEQQVPKIATNIEIIKTLTKLKIKRPQAEKIIENYEEDKILEAIALAKKAMYKHKEDDNFSIAGYIIKILENDVVQENDNNSSIKINLERLNLLEAGQQQQVKLLWSSWSLGTKRTFNKYGLESPHISNLLNKKEKLFEMDEQMG